MIASRVAPFTEVEGAEVDGVEGVGRAAVPNRLINSTHNVEVVGHGKRNKKMV